MPDMHIHCVLREVELPRDEFVVPAKGVDDQAGEPFIAPATVGGDRLDCSAINEATAKGLKFNGRPSPWIK